MDTLGHCFPKSIIIQAVYLKLRFTLSYRDVEEILRIRGVDVDHARNRNPDAQEKEDSR
jgi:putative transposase